MSWTSSGTGLPSNRFSGVNATDFDKDGDTDILLTAYNAGSGVVTGPDDLARNVKDLTPNIDVKVTDSAGGDTAKNAPLDLSVSKAELGYVPKYPLKEALQDYMDELWGEGARG